MQLINLKPSTVVEKSKRPLVIGFFDGLHQGHKALFTGLKTEQYDILTFINVPSKSNDFIYPSNLRIADLIKLKPHKLYVWNLKFLNMKASKFTLWVKNRITPQIIHVGKNFKFGSDQKTYVAFIKYGLKTKAINIKTQCSSTKVKTLLKRGNIVLLNKLLLEPYSVVGKVITGKMQGRKLGYRTANVAIDRNCIAPLNGSYSGYTYVNDVKFKSAIFVRNHLVETHIFNFNRNIYDDVITIEFKKFHQLPNKSTSFENLKTTLDKKVKSIRTSF